ncbi:sigma-54 interaction domain-containing protein [Cytobacillus purgationiresistens]|uniref:PAS domain S-box-containing protein n=1 Tax=Cytobacillus purgationiresistens TaxID=863449 RepID=A0ABU0AFD6_9BACI|nr:sigma 54-interacting transcriptional regulator [Cytobacillus purgationiresistens]MDQ0269148.1 PAS domain S-box-containing protein [Cytobacillus purgationiresistens]
MNLPSGKHALLYLQTLIETSSDGITIIDASGQVQYWNSHAERIYGIPFKKIKGNYINDFFKEEDLMLLQILKTKEPVFNVYHQPRPDKHVLISSSPILDEQHDQLIGAISIDHDITHIVKLNEKLTLTSAQLQKMKQSVQVMEYTGPFSDLKGKSPAIQKAKEFALKVASTEATVLIQGESGVGKELFSQGIHDGSLRSSEPFIPVNCGAIPEALFESEFFGYERGSFTGAHKEGKPGKIELAHKGSLFLDEIGILPLDMQAKLLRVLQEREVFRIGGSQAKKVDIRIIAATNSDLEDMVQKGLFREDLYYRLNVVTLKIPPLRDRNDDIPLLVQSFADEFSIKYKKQAVKLHTSAINMYTSYDWPGNIRELKNVVERMIIFNEQPTVHANNLSEIFPYIKDRRIPKEGLAHEKALFEKEKITDMLQQTHGNKSAAAKKLGISRVSLYKKLKEYHIEMDFT